MRPEVIRGGLYGADALRSSKCEGVDRIIDAHTHVGRFGSWAQVGCTAKELIREMDEAAVTKSILFAPDNLLVRKAVSGNPQRFVGYVWPNPHEQTATKLVRTALRKWGFRGVKLHPLLHAFLPTDDIVLKIMDVAQREKVPVAIHSGHPPFSLPWSIGELAEIYRNVKIVMLHMGHGHGVYIQAAINTAKRYDNIILETSGMPMHTKIKQAVREVGEDRVVFGSDFPFHHHSVELQKVTVASLTRRERELLLYENAASLLI
jgi:predicted TIM-barrel fold metal-dependent hydrolase